MSGMLDLDNISNMIHAQAIAKGWKTEGNFCVKRAFEEFNEFAEAIEQKKSPEEIASEAIDIFYFILQAVRDKAKNQSMNTAFLLKYEDNWVKKKKTEDEKGNVVRK